MNLISVAYAASGIDTFGKVVDPIISTIVNPVIMLIFAVGVVVFVYGVFQVIWGEPGGEAHEKGKKSMWYGIIGMFIMLSAWGIVNLVANTVKGI
jgi:hypothetical protein